MKISVVIPARLASTRFPRKVLADLGGKSVLERVYERVKQMTQAHEVRIAVDTEEVAAHARGFGAAVLMTDPNCPNGTARIASVRQALSGDFVLNVQGDEPFVDPAMLDKLCLRARDYACDCVTAVYRLKSPEQIENPNLVKVVRTSDGRALYFSRSAVPYMRDVPRTEWVNQTTYWGHIGVYGYSQKLLAAYESLPVCELETIEKLEQLRFLNHGFTIQTVETTHTTPGIDTPEDLAAALRYLNEMNKRHE